MLLHMCTINEDHMMYDSWDIRQSFLSFWAIFCPLTLLTVRKIKILKKMKKKNNNNWRYYHFTYVFHKWKSYDVWFLRYGAGQTEFFLTDDLFFVYLPPNNPENQNFEKWKKRVAISFTQVYHKWQSYDAWFLRYVSFWVIFCSFTPLTTQKIKILKKWKKELEIPSFYTGVPNIMIVCYTVPEIWHVFFTLLPL